MFTISPLIKRLVGVVALGLAALGLAITQAPSASAAPNCGGPSGVVLIGVRGTNQAPESAGPQVNAFMGSLRERIQQSRTVQEINVKYPARGLPNVAEYPGSVRAGVSSLAGELETNARDCPARQAVVYGFSQGAQVVGNALTGSLSERAKNSVRAAILIGDPRYNSGAWWSRGNARGTVNFPVQTPRPRNAFDSLKPRVGSWCVKGDWACHRYPDDGTHSSFYQSPAAAGYRGEAADLAVSQLR